ncbi:MAG: tyrosine-type recombinase/integrase [Rhodospirillales bacterium]|jgi:integrase
MAQEIVSSAETYIAPAARPEQAAQAAAERAAKYENAAYSANTQRAYNRAWARFCVWAGLVDPVPLPVPLEIVRAYLTHLADTKSLSTVDLAAAAISAFHELAGQPIAIHELWRARRGIRNTLGTAAKRKAPPLRTDQIAKMLDVCGLDKTGIRDRAILALGFSAGLRRSEIANLTIDNVEIDAQKMRLKIRRSKSDQAGQGAELVVERTPRSDFCAVAAVEAWIKEAEIFDGALFRAVNKWGYLNHSKISGEAIRAIVRNRAIEAGLKRDDFRAHSLRAGLATSAFDLGISLQAVSKRLRHKNPRTTQGYDRRTAVEDAAEFRELYPERVADMATKLIKVGETVMPIDDAELKRLIREAEEARLKVEARLQSLGEKTK